MTRSAVAVAGVALLVATAGCGGFVGGADTPNREPYDVDPTPTPTATTAADRPTATRSAPLAAAAFQAAVANHTDALRSAGNFTVRQWRESARGGGNVTPGRVETIAVDLGAGRYAQGRSPVGGNGSFVVGTYQNATAVYRRTAEGEGPAFWNVTGLVDVYTVTPRRAATTTVQYAGEVGLRLPFERNGTATVDGEVVARYTADDPGRFRGWPTAVRTVGDFSATALVDDRGIVRRFRYEVRGRLDTGATYVESGTVAVVDVGETRVPWPDALANATPVGQDGNPTGGEAG